MTLTPSFHSAVAETPKLITDMGEEPVQLLLLPLCFPATMAKPVSEGIPNAKKESTISGITEALVEVRQQ